MLSYQFLLTSLLVVLNPGTGVIYLLHMVWSMWPQSGVLPQFVLADTNTSVGDLL